MGWRCNMVGGTGSATSFRCGNVFEGGHWADREKKGE